MTHVTRNRLLVCALIAFAIFGPTGALAVCSVAQMTPEPMAELDNGCMGQPNPIDWDFEWEPCEGATQYQLIVRSSSAQFPVVDTVLTGTSYSYRSWGYIIERNRRSWIWQVRAFVDGAWGPYSVRFFDVEPETTDCTVPVEKDGWSALKARFGAETRD